MNNDKEIIDLTLDEDEEPTSKRPRILKPEVKPKKTVRDYFVVNSPNVDPGNVKPSTSAINTDPANVKPSTSAINTDDSDFTDAELQMIKKWEANREEPNEISAQTGAGLNYSHEYFTIERTRERLVKKFGYVGSDYKIRFRNLPKEIHELQATLFLAVKTLLEFITLRLKRSDRIRIIIFHDCLDQPIQLPYMQVHDLTVEMILAEIHRVAQSKKELKLDEALNMHASVVSMPEGKGLNERFEKFVMGKTRGIIQIRNRDSLCALRAIIVGQGLADKRENVQLTQKYKLLIDSRSPVQTKKALALAKAIGISNNVCGLREIIKAEKYLNEYQVLIVDKDKKFEFIYTGVRERAKKIFLVYHDNHFDVISSLPAFFGKPNFCNVCLKGYRNDITHPCNNYCRSCKNKFCPNQPVIKCQLCFSKCTNDLCLTLHQENVCPKLQRCEECKRLKTWNHVCGGRWCYNCKKAVEWDHKCFILTEAERNVGRKVVQKQKGYIFFDYECMIGESCHIPNLICAEKICASCCEDWKRSPLQNCVAGCGVKIFYTNDEFCEWILKQKNFICIAHNMRAYDGMFVMNYFVENPLPNDKNPEIVLNGCKLMNITFNNVKFIDSYNFIPMALAKFATTFGIVEKKKGYFPHLLNTPNNQNLYMDHLPAIEYYSPEFMSEKDRNAFLAWHKRFENSPFNLKDELLTYCLSDVDILKHGCMLYRDMFLQVTKRASVPNDIGIDPFQNCLTLPSACHLIFRRNFMIPESIALIADNGFNPSQNYSHNQMLWLKYQAQCRKTNIQHCFNGKEKKIGPYSVDGYCAETQTVFEFYGCYIHGCLTCYSAETINSLRKSSMGYLNKENEERKKYIVRYCKNIVEIWEHEWLDMCATDAVIKAFVQNEKVMPPIRPRDALYGGRTNASKLYHACNEEEKIKYYDFTSLYPFVQKTCRFPFGLPEIINDYFDYTIPYFGLIQCCILPPRKLRFPVLPARINNKLIFTLCRHCAYEKSSQCGHSDEERSLEGTWVTEEVKQACACGYEIVKIYSVWHWPKTSIYDNVSKEGGLFTEYVNTFLKIKQENSGYPSWCTNDETRKQYIDEYYEKEGIRLDETKITVNEGLRSISKFLLNSMWGRYCMQTNKTKFKWISSVEELYQMLLAENLIIQNIYYYEHAATVFYTEEQQLHIGSNDNNLVLGAFVTCYGRLKLLEEMQKIGDRVLYYDTDSIIFVSKNNEYEPELGDYLGEFSNEIKGPNGNHIVEFVSAGPKNYAYKTDNGRTFCKIKGFAVNFAASEKLNFDSMKDIVVQKRCDTIEVEQNIFIRNVEEWNVKTEVLGKQYRLVYDKRILLDDLSTLPYGY